MREACSEGGGADLNRIAIISRLCASFGCVELELFPLNRWPAPPVLSFDCQREQATVPYEYEYPSKVGVYWKQRMYILAAHAAFSKRSTDEVRPLAIKPPQERPRGAKKGQEELKGRDSWLGLPFLGGRPPQLARLVCGYWYPFHWLVCPLRRLVIILRRMRVVWP